MKRVIKFRGFVRYEKSYGKRDILMPNLGIRFVWEY